MVQYYINTTKFKFKKKIYILNLFLILNLTIFVQSHLKVSLYTFGNSMSTTAKSRSDKALTTQKGNSKHVPCSKSSPSELESR